MHLLLSNDDGIHAEGLRRLREGLQRARPQWRLTTVAPDREQSGTSHSLTLNDPLRVTEVEAGVFAVTGTPTDSVLVAVHGLLQEDPPDAVLAGLNQGPNMGEDVHYSGTVAAAMEGKLLDLPSLSLSVAFMDGRRDFGAAQHFVEKVMPDWLERGWGRAVLLNVNIPALPASEVRGVRLCRLGTRQYHEIIVRKQDPRGRDYYWIGGAPTFSREEDTDFSLCSQGYVTVTPLRLDMTDNGLLAELRRVEESWRT